jgi:membrane protease YdiL (CAAX protease family)
VRTIILIGRLIVFPLFIAMLVVFFKKRVAGDRKLKIAATAAAVPSLAATIALGFSTRGSLELRDAVSLFGFLVLGLVLWAPIYVGILLREKEPASYWFGHSQRYRPWDLVLWAICAVLILLIATAAIYKKSGIALHMPIDTNNVALVVGYVFSQLVWALAEEYFYRGCAQSMLIDWLKALKFNKPLGIVLIAIVFTLQHPESTYTAASFLQVLLVGIVLGYSNLRYGLIGAAVVHFAFNVCGLYVLPIAYCLF